MYFSLSTHYIFQLFIFTNVAVFFFLNRNVAYVHSSIQAQASSFANRPLFVFLNTVTRLENPLYTPILFLILLDNCFIAFLHGKGSVERMLNVIYSTGKLWLSLKMINVYFRWSLNCCGAKCVCFLVIRYDNHNITLIL